MPAEAMPFPGRSRLKTVWNVGGGGLGLIGVVFVALRFRQHPVPLNSTLRGMEVALFLVPALLAVLGAGLMMALAWRCLLGHLQVHLSRRTAFSVYGLSQISKYIPGNVFQFWGRQALGAAGACLAPRWQNRAFGSSGPFSRPPPSSCR